MDFNWTPNHGAVAGPSTSPPPVRETQLVCVLQCRLVSYLHARQTPRLMGSSWGWLYIAIVLLQPRREVVILKAEFFQSIGMTNSEIKAYAALLSQGPCDARTICNASSVPFGKIYDVLYSLERRGLVKVQRSRPKMFMAVEPRLGVRSLLETKEKELQSLHDQAAVVEDELGRSYRARRDNSIFWSVAVGPDNCKPLLLGAFKEARKEVLIYKDVATLQRIVGRVLDSTSGQNATVPQITQALEVEIRFVIGKMEENVGFRVLVGGTKNLVHLKKLVRGSLHALPRSCEIRATNHVAGSFTLIDGEKILLDLRNPIEANEDMALIYIWQRNLGKAFKEAFERMWETASPFRT